MTRKLPWIAGALAAAAALSIALVDTPLARALDGRGAALRPIWKHGIEGLEVATGFPISRWFAAAMLAAATAIAYAVPRWRGAAPTWLFVTAAHLVPRFTMGLAKTAFGRLRPREWLEAGGADGTFFLGGSSFPSGHIVHFGTLVLAVVILRPRLWPLLAVPLFIGIARVAMNEHFASDVLAAAAFTVLLVWAFARLLRFPRA